MQISRRGRHLEWSGASAICVAAIALACIPHHHRENLGGLPDVVTSEVDEGGPNPATIAMALANPGTCALDFTIAVSTVDGAPWLSTSPNAGTVAAGTQQMIGVTLDVVTVPLPPGTYTGSITVAGTCSDNSRPAAGSPAVVAVNLTVKAHRAGLSLGTSAIDQDVVTLQDAWSPLTGGPSPRGGHTAVWTGDSMIVWGGGSPANAVLGDGSAYDPVTSGWTPVSNVAAPMPRVLHAAVWTGSRMLVWGGSTTPDGTSGLTNTGALYDPLADVWTPTSTVQAPAGRNHFCAAWAGSIGKVVVWGGATASSSLSDGALYDPAADSWTAMPPAPLAGRSSASCAWTGSEFIVWGGVGAGNVALGDGAVWHAASNAWSTMTSNGAPTPRYVSSSVFSGSRFLVWGGFGQAGYLGDGASYDPARDRWTLISASGAPSSRDFYQTTAAAWTGSRLVIWGGYATSAPTNTGAVYDPVTDAWSPMTTAGAPSARTGHTSVWTGDALIVFGGGPNGSATDAGIYR